MNGVFSIQDRQEVFDHILSVAGQDPRIVALVQVGSGACGYHDERSDLDFVVALDSDASMSGVMDALYERIASGYDVLYHKKAEARHLQVIVLSNLLEIDMGFGGYEHAAARKPEFKVLFDRTGVVEKKMLESRAWMDERIWGEKRKKDREEACSLVWSHLMHAAVAIRRGRFLRAVGELETVRRVYLDLLGDRYRLESGCNHDLDKLPEKEIDAVKSTLVKGEDADALWSGLLNLTSLIYGELEGCDVPVSKERLLEYYRGLR